MRTLNKDKLKRGGFAFYHIIKNLYDKYQADNGHIIVASIAFYILLTFIPFTLLSIYILGHVIDISNLGMHIETYIRNILPPPYNGIFANKLIQQMKVISVSKKLSGPIGFFTLFLFTMKLFSVMETTFSIIFHTSPRSFVKRKGKELLLTAVISAFQAVLFFSSVAFFLLKSKVVQDFSHLEYLPYFFSLFSLIDIVFTFVMFLMLYSFLTPVRDKKVLVYTTAIGTVFWYVGKQLFQYYILHMGRVMTFFGTYGVFIVFLFWIYFSVFIFITCAELQSVILGVPNREPESSSSRTQG